ncbi:unnamed protein product, partial [marine sediment metagenome]
MRGKQKIGIALSWGAAGGLSHIGVLEDIFPPDKTSSDNQYADINNTDISELRLCYTEAIRYFEDESYLIAEYYLYKIKDSYLVLQ